MTSIIVTAICGIVTTAVASLVTWLLSKKKYNSEVDGNNIKNMQESLGFYVRLADDYSNRLAEEIKDHNEEVKLLKQENAELKKELKEQEKKFDQKIEANQREINLMKNQMLSVYGQVCLNFKCVERKLTLEDKE
jgi:septal ring factor EnvC (AmiA/AmiB activator)